MLARARFAVVSTRHASAFKRSSFSVIHNGRKEKKTVPTLFLSLAEIYQAVVATTSPPASPLVDRTDGTVSFCR